jgi:hypothetical protein
MWGHCEKCKTQKKKRTLRKYLKDKGNELETNRKKL